MTVLLEFHFKLISLLEAFLKRNSDVNANTLSIHGFAAGPCILVVYEDEGPGRTCSNKIGTESHLEGLLIISYRFTNRRQH